jgi:hypothetical protein
MELWWSEALGPCQGWRWNKAALLIYTTWSLWMERNKRIFEAKEASPLQVSRFIPKELGLQK